jgi:hypothetical protein
LHIGPMSRERQIILNQPLCRRVKRNEANLVPLALTCDESARAMTLSLSLTPRGFSIANVHCLRYIAVAVGLLDERCCDKVFD